MYQFRKVDVSTDIGEFHQLMNDLVEHTIQEEKMVQIIERYNQREDAYLMVVEDLLTHTLVGSLLAIIVEDYSEDGRPLCYIENVVVKKSEQRKGIGKKMIEEIERWAKQFDVNYLLLVSSNERIGAHQFYENIGFETVKGFKKYFFKIK